MTEHKNCKWNFAKWLVKFAIKEPRIYWLFWGALIVLAICAWKFGFAGVL